MHLSPVFLVAIVLIILGAGYILFTRYQPATGNHTLTIISEDWSTAPGFTPIKERRSIPVTVGEEFTINYYGNIVTFRINAVYEKRVVLTSWFTESTNGFAENLMQEKGESSPLVTKFGTKANPKTHSITGTVSLNYATSMTGGGTKYWAEYK